MEIMEIKADKYSITYSADEGIVTCNGSLLLNGMQEYDPIFQLLKTAAVERQAQDLIIDIRDLKFLNSSGINMITKFIIHISDVEPLNVDIIVVGYKRVAWQEKLSKNLKRLLPTLQTKLE
jgi:hypothetical protein